jgi:thiamine biosynthesis lipoprotein
VISRHSFHAMGTTIELLVDADDGGPALAAAEAEFHRLEALLSRFRPDSQLSCLNEAGMLHAGPDLVRVVELALEARARSGGRFDPTIHDALVAAGYDRSFEQLRVDDEGEPQPPGRHHHARSGGEVVVEGDTIRLAEHVRLDLGGIGKGYAAERAAELLATAGRCLVNAGGDIATRGGSWPVGVEVADSTITLELSGGAGLATSGRDRRRWRRRGRELHHLIDPRTGEPAETDLLRITVVASDAVEAEVAATTLFLACAEHAAAEANQRALPAVLVTDSGHTILTGGLA